MPRRQCDDAEGQSEQDDVADRVREANRHGGRRAADPHHRVEREPGPDGRRAEGGHGGIEPDARLVVPELGADQQHQRHGGEGIEEEREEVGHRGRRRGRFEGQGDAAQRPGEQSGAERQRGPAFRRPGERQPETGQGEGEGHGDDEWAQLAGAPGEQGDGAQQQEGDGPQREIAPGPARPGHRASSPLRLQHHVVKSAFQRWCLTSLLSGLLQLGRNRVR